MARAGQSDKRPQKDAQVAICRRSEHHDVFIGCQNQRCPYYCIGQGTGATYANLGKRAVPFTACLVCGFPDFNLRSTAVNNKLE